ncbi:hypothetical protein DPMN_016304 [Dreissena polymorpha]|uniref:Uncharacterized protein n=1 Tax=Dreissena polymorpha TaxID=45954 RepID=A0A9D4NCN7_DREPO|nr:hypothetical protein DPMN_016304 [Dreissena polymorpha]
MSLMPYAGNVTPAQPVNLCNMVRISPACQSLQYGQDQPSLSIFAIWSGSAQPVNLCNMVRISPACQSLQYGQDQPSLSIFAIWSGFTQAANESIILKQTA